MSATIIASLRAAVFQAISVLGESKTRTIINKCFADIEEDHWGR